ncbi:MAG TPA: group II intron maturase-specific domain-containing protein [Candidatus Dormibacteraeota bacterium]
MVRPRDVGHPELRQRYREGQEDQLSALGLKQLGPVLRGWAVYFRHGVSMATFRYLFHYTWKRVGRWMRRKHPHVRWSRLQQRYTRDGWLPEQDGIALFNPASVPIIRYRFRGALIPTSWSQNGRALTNPLRLVESRMR